MEAPHESVKNRRGNVEMIVTTSMLVIFFPNYYGRMGCALQTVWCQQAQHCTYYIVTVCVLD